MPSQILKNIKDDFPILNREINGKKLVYLDSASTSQKPLKVINALEDYYKNHNANIHRGVYTLSEEATKMYEDSRELVRKFINANSLQEIIFTKNTTEGLNLLAYSWGNQNLTKNDTVVLSIMEHHSNIVPWQILSEKIGFKIIYLDINEEGVLNLNQLLEVFNNNQVKLVSITHISNVTGTVNDIKEITKIAHKNGATVIVDAAQSTPHRKIDVIELDVDFLVFSSHKMMGPTGVGVLYGKQNVLEAMQPFLAGGDMITRVTVENTIYRELPYKFEAGTPNIAGVIGLAEAIRYLENIGMDNIKNHEEMITEYTLRKLELIPEIKMYGPKSATNKGGVVSFLIKNIHPHDTAQILDEYGIAIRSGHHCAMPLTNYLKIDSTARASFYIYNTIEDIEKLYTGILEVIKKFN